MRVLRAMSIVFHNVWVGGKPEILFSGADPNGAYLKRV
jgi:hypothetical protein